MNEDIKTVKSPAGHEYRLVKGSRMFSCCACGAGLENLYMTACSDCGGLFCENCVKDGTFDNHECEEDDMPEEED